MLTMTERRPRTMFWKVRTFIVIGLVVSALLKFVAGFIFDPAKLIFSLMSNSNVTDSWDLALYFFVIGAASATVTILTCWVAAAYIARKDAIEMNAAKSVARQVVMWSWLALVPAGLMFPLLIGGLFGGTVGGGILIVGILFSPILFVLAAEFFAFPAFLHKAVLKTQTA